MRDSDDQAKAEAAARKEIENTVENAMLDYLSKEASTHEVAQTIASRILRGRFFEQYIQDRLTFLMRHEVRRLVSELDSAAYKYEYGEGFFPGPKDEEVKQDGAQEEA